MRSPPAAIPAAAAHHARQDRTATRVVAAARELTDRDAARALRGARVFVARSSFPTAADDEYYWVDLIGAEVVNREGCRWAA